MKTHVLRGSKQEIADGLARITGEVREAIVFFEDRPLAAPEARQLAEEDIFAEMSPFMVDAPDIDDTRTAIYTRMENE